MAVQNNANNWNTDAKGMCKGHQVNRNALKSLKNAKAAEDEANGAAPKNPEESVLGKVAVGKCDWTAEEWEQWEAEQANKGADKANNGGATSTGSHAIGDYVWDEQYGEGEVVAICSAEESATGAEMICVEYWGFPDDSDYGAKKQGAGTRMFCKGKQLLKGMFSPRSAKSPRSARSQTSAPSSPLVENGADVYGDFEEEEQW